jgi:integrase/recombinase XerD
MITAIEHYLAVRHATGFTLANTTYLLRSFGRFAVARGDTHIRTATAIAWAAQSVSATQRSERLKTVCRLARYLHVEDAHHEIPPPDHFGSPKRRPVPYLYSQEEIRQLLAAARQLSPLDSVRPHTYATVLGLLAATGLRVSEALTLHLADLTPSGLVIRRTKFGKTRLVPLHDTTVQVLEQYRSRWRPGQSAEAMLFVDEEGTPLQYGKFYRTFQQLVTVTQLARPTGRRLRLHDLRHTFAVRALEASPPGRQHLSCHMLALATYLGHVGIHTTYWYLDTTPDLLRDVARAAEAFLEGGPA